MTDYAFPRRNRIDQFTPAERAIWDATQEVERAGCDVLLTEAVNLLQAARAKVADYVDASSSPAEARDGEERERAAGICPTCHCGYCESPSPLPASDPSTPEGATNE
jgi:superfamily II DNA helicase RecQ